MLASNSVKEQLYKPGKKSPPPSQIGEILKDSLGVVQARFTTDNKSPSILKSKGFTPDLLKGLCHLIRKAIAIPKYLEESRKDKEAKFHCILRERARFTYWFVIIELSKFSSPVGNMSHPQFLL